MTTIRLTGNYGYVAQRLSGLSTGTIVDATSATFTQDNWAGDGGSNNPYPFQVVQVSGAVILGGTIIGQTDQKSDWRTVYDHGNSAAVRIEDAPNAIIRDWRISNTWDAIRVSWNSQNFVIEDVWVTNTRDDAVENDRIQSGTIRDSLFDGVFGGISVDPSSSSPVDGHNETVTLDGVLLRLQPSLYLGEMTHSAFIKTDSATPGTVTPHFRFINNVIAIEDVTHHSYRSLLDAWAHTVESSGNYYLNLSDTPLPADYPKPPAGWTVLQGQAARDYWNAARADWVDRHSGATPTFSGTSFTGNDTAETIIGNAFDNMIYSQGGNDTISGGEGGDKIFGGNGNDVLKGQGGADHLYGGLGADNYFGGSGVDYARYDDANYGNLTIRLDASGSNTGAAAGDTYTEIEGLVGGAGDDMIIGNGLANYLFGSGGSDRIMGFAGNDYLNGGEGTNHLWGGAGADVHFGGSGIDYARYDDANWGNLTLRLDAPSLNIGAAAVGDTYVGIEGIIAGSGSDVVIGNGSANYLLGGGGSDYINALAGNDYMNGGTGADRFVFSTALNSATNADVIADFVHASDDILLAQSIFTAIGSSLSASELRFGTAAVDANDYLIYDSTTGHLFYDANGSGSGGQTLFATVTAGTVLDIGDFVVF